MKSMIVMLGMAAVFGVATIADAEARSRSYGSYGGSHSVRSYYKPSTGTFVGSHRATNRNYTRMDNWSTRGNVNPYTGRVGTKNPW